MTIRVSVVIPTYHRPELLTRCLGATLAQRLDPTAYEVIVADDGDDPVTAAVVEALARQAARRGVALRYIALRGAHGPAAARNAGWRQACGPIIAFTDDDCVPDPGWLSAGVAAMAEGVAGVSGRLIVPHGAPGCARPTDYERNAALLANAEFITANCFYRRDALAAVGGLDERFPVAWREDSDLAFTLMERGARLDYAHDAVVVHPIRPAPWGVSVRQQQRSMYNALLYRKHPRLYRKRIQAAPPWSYYASVAALLLSLCALWRRQPRTLWLGLGLWSALTARFAARRLRGASHAPERVCEMLVTSALIPPICVFWRLLGAVRYRAPFL